MSSDVPALIADIRAAISSDLSKFPSTDSASSLPSVSTAISAAAAAAARTVAEGSALRCERCGLSGLLRGSRSAVCVFCAAPRRDAEGFVFSDTASCRWLLGSFGLNGSEPLCSDTEPADSSKPNDSPPNGMVLSDLLDLKLIWLPEKHEAGANMKEITPSTHTASLTGADLGTLFSESKKGIATFHADHETRKDQTARSQSLSVTDSTVLSKEFPSEAKPASRRSSDEASIHSFANWEADFQGVSNKELVESPSEDLFHTDTVNKSVVLADVELTTIEERLYEHKTRVEQANIEDLKTSDSSSLVGITFRDNPGSGKNVFSERSQSKSSVATGIASSGHELLSDQHEFSTSGGQCAAMPNALEHLESAEKHFEVNNLDTLSGSTKASNSCEFGDFSNSNEVNFDDWQAFTYSERNGIGDSNDVASASNINDDFNDWSEYSSVARKQTGLPNVGGGQQDDILSLDGPKPHIISEIIVEAKNVDAWPSNSRTSETKESTDTNHDNGITLDNWLISADYSEAKHLETSIDNTNLNKKDEVFDDWQDFITSDGQNAALSEITKGTDPVVIVDPCEKIDVGSATSGIITSEDKEIKDNSGDLSDNWKDYKNSGAQKTDLSTMISNHTETVNDPYETKYVDSLLSNKRTPEAKELKGSYSSELTSAASWPSDLDTYKFNNVMDNGPADTNSLQMWPSSLKISGVKEHESDDPFETRSVTKFPDSMQNHNFNESSDGTGGGMGIFDDWLAVTSNTMRTHIESSSEDVEDWHEFSTAAANLPSAGEVKNSNAMRGASDTKYIDLWSSSARSPEVVESGGAGNTEIESADVWPSRMKAEDRGDGDNGILDDWQGFASKPGGTYVVSSSGTGEVNNTDEVVDDWLEYTSAGEQQVVGSGVREKMESTVNRHQGIKFSGSPPKHMKAEDSGDGDNGIFDDWQGFASKPRGTYEVSSSGTTEVNNTDEVVDDWLEYTSAGEQQVVGSGVCEKMEFTVNRHQEIKISSSPLKDMKATESMDNGGSVDNFFNDWPDFTTNSYQGSTSTSFENNGSIPVKRSSDPTSFILQPADDFRGLKDSKYLKENSESYDDWAEFVSSDHNPAGSPKPELISTSCQHPKESISETILFTNSTEDSKRVVLPKETSSINDDDDDWEDFSSSVQPPGSLKNSRLDDHTIFSSKDSSQSGPIDILSLYNSKDYNGLNLTKVSSTLYDDQQNSSSFTGNSKDPSVHTEFPPEHHTATKAALLHEVGNVGILNHDRVYKSQSLNNRTMSMPVDLFSRGTNSTHQMDGVDSLISAWEQPKK